MLTSLLKCRACRLSWFPQGGAAAACPACGGTQVGGTLELFHVGVLLILVAVAGWVAPSVLGDNAGIFAVGVAPTVPAVIQSKEVTANVENGPARGETVTLRRGEEVTIVKQERRRVLVKDRRGNQVYVSKKKLKKRHKAKKRSEHVQR